ncbi:Rrf2 family transcriptional regulator [Gammaproteobacteria bacterium]|nr:Rrf2 family transcriptional regulator [Gammaproteobacteria bacterium]|tara:strand:+ start:2511 stop:2963 length:453 start_codon:yes stop_codon:yes gene_type:complete
MNLTTRGKYAVTASLDLAMNYEKNSYVAISEIAERQSIPAAYLEQLFRYLRKAGILTSLRGPGGGYRLTRPNSDIKIGEIIAAVERKMDATQCGGEGNCSAGSKCLAHNLWTELNNEVDLFLMNKSLDDVINRNFIEKKQLANSLLITSG